MEQIFLKILNMSITASYLVLAIVLLRILLKKAPKWLRCSLWVLVGIRLMLPFSFESVLSLIPSAHTVPEDILYAQVPAIQSGIPAVNSSLNPIIFESMAPTLGNSVNPMQIAAYIASFVWIVGMGIMLLYAAISYRRIRSRVQNTKFLRENIVICPQVDTPFILGIFRPTIFLPEGLAEMDTEYVIAHEKAHLRRKDHWWKPLGFLLLTTHWFNPVLWIAYILLCRDIELACDEKVIRELGVENKKPYAEALINCSAPRKLISACPLAFGESGIKGRIQSVLHYKKPTLWILIAALILSVATSVCFLLDPPEERLNNQQAMYMTVVASLPDSPAIEKDYFYARDSYGTLYKVGKTPPQNRTHNDASDTLAEGDLILVHAGNKVRIRDYRGYPENRQPRYVIQASSIQLHTTSNKWLLTPFSITTCDIDNDGVRENIGLCHGFTSGLFTFIVEVWNDDGVKYCNIFYYLPGELSFTEKNGRLQIRHHDYQGDNQVRYLDIQIIDNEIFLFHNGEPIKMAQKINR